MTTKKSTNAASQPVFVVRESEVKKDPAKLWSAVEAHGRVQVIDAKKHVVIDLAGYGGAKGLRWDA